MTQVHDIQPPISNLSKYPVASLRELIYLAFPIILTTLSSSLLNLSDRLFLSHYSAEAWKASTVAGDLSFFFQMFCILLVVTAQVFVGQYHGGNKSEKIGPLIWQMIWFSFLSMIITYPISLFSESFFHGTEIEAPATLYFRCLTLSNFLYPLAAALSTFFLGRGKTKIILISNISIHIVNILLDYLLIFGVKGIIPPLGILGAAIATIVSEATLCMILYTFFIHKKYVHTYRTDLRKLDKKMLWEVLKVGIPRACGRAMVIFTWNAAARIMVVKGGDFLLSRTLGTSLFAIFSFINQGMGQAILILASNLIGANWDNELRKLIKNAYIFLLGIIVILTIPLFFFQNHLIHIFIGNGIAKESLSIFRACCSSILFICLGNGIMTIGVSLIMAYKDTFFYFLSTLFPWITLFLPSYIGIGLFNLPPQTFFIIDGANSVIIGIALMLYVQRKFIYSTLSLARTK